MVMNYRCELVLLKKTILKSDHFPGCQNKLLLSQIDEAPNYRQAGSLRVHGVAIPTISGIRNVLKSYWSTYEQHAERSVMSKSCRRACFMTLVYIFETYLDSDNMLLSSFLAFLSSWNELLVKKNLNGLDLTILIKGTAEHRRGTVLDGQPIIRGHL